MAKLTLSILTKKLATAGFAPVVDATGDEKIITLNTGHTVAFDDGVAALFADGKPLLAATGDVAALLAALPAAGVPAGDDVAPTGDTLETAPTGDDVAPTATTDGVKLRTATKKFLASAVALWGDTAIKLAVDGDKIFVAPADGGTLANPLTATKPYGLNNPVWYSKQPALVGLAAGLIKSMLGDKCQIVDSLAPAAVAADGVAADAAPAAE